MKSLIMCFILIGCLLAASSASSEDKIYACVKKNNGQVRIVAATEPCGPSEKSISWNIGVLPGSGAAPQTLEAVQNATLSGLGGTWLNIPGLELSFTLTKETPVNLSAFGSVSLGGSESVYLSFLVDGSRTGYGETTPGKPNYSAMYPVELGLGYIDTSGNFFWRIERDLQLSEGTHTIIVQMFLAGGGGATSSITQQHDPGLQSVLRVRY